MENFNQPSQENLTAFTRSFLERAAHPYTAEDEELAHIIEIAERDRVGAKRALLNHVVAAHLFENERDAEEWSDALLSNITANQSEAMPLAALAALAPQIVAATRKADRQAYIEEAMPPPSDAGIRKQEPQGIKRTQTPAANSQYAMNNAPLNMPQKNSIKSPFNVQNAKQELNEKRGQEDAPQNQKPGGNNEEKLEEMQQSGQQQQTTSSRKQKKKMGLFKRTMIVSGAITASGVTVAGIIIF